MAAFLGVAQTSEVALSAATAKTVLQVIAPSNHRLRLKRYSVSFDGTSATAEPAVVQLVRQTNAGTMSSLTPAKLDDSIAETLQTTAAHTATVEPTATDVLDQQEVHPQGGIYDVILPDGFEYIVGGGDRVAIKITSPSAVNVIAKIVFEE